MMRREKGLRGNLAVLVVIVALTAGCQLSGAGTGASDTIPDTTATVPTTEQQATTTTTLTDEQAAYNVYRTFLDASLAIGSDFNREPDDGSLDAFTTPTYRAPIVVNLRALKTSGVTQKGRLLTRLLGSDVEGATANLRVCRRDDVDQFDRTGKQLTPVGPGVPRVAEVRLLRVGAAWLIDNAKGTDESCAV